MEEKPAPAQSGEHFRVGEMRQPGTPSDDPSRPLISLPTNLEQVKRIVVEIDKYDWRTHKVIPGLLHEGNSVREIAVGLPVTCAFGEQKLGFSIPNATALFLSLSHRFHNESVPVLNNAILSGKQVTGRTALDLPSDGAFTFLENIMASVVFAHASMEAFANEEIPENYIFTRSDRQHTKQFDKKQIERYLSLEVKIGEVLPEVLKKPTPKGTPLWKEFLTLAGIRDRIIHMKTADQRQRGENPQSIWSDLMKSPLPETYSVAKRIIGYFLEGRSSELVLEGEVKECLPRWITKCPF